MLSPNTWTYCTTAIVTIVLSQGQPGVSSAKPQNELNLVGLFPMRSRWEPSKPTDGPGVIPAVQLALTHVKESLSILPNHDLRVEINDTQCDMAVGTKLFFDMMHEPPEKVMLFGDACSDVTAPIAMSAPYWNISQLSYADTNPVLSDRVKYPNFFRTVPSYTDHNPARLRILEHFKWKRVGTLFQDASKDASGHDYAHNRLTDLLDMHGIHRDTESFAMDPKPALTKLKENDTRIIIGNFGEAVARKVFCAAREQHMYGAKYAWIIPGYYSAGWWSRQDADIQCSPDELREVLQGCIGTDALELSSTGRKTIANITAEEYRGMYEKARANKSLTYSKYHGYAYDGIWVISKAIDSIIKMRRGRFDITDFRSELLNIVLNETKFEGVTGTVSFQNGDRVGGIEIKQFQGNRMVKIGEYDAYSSNIYFDADRSFLWPGSSGKPPRDKSITIMELHKVSRTVYAVMCTFAGMGMVLAIIFLAMNIRCRNHRYIKMSSPNMNNLIIQGCILFYLSVFLLGTDGGLLSSDGYGIMCSARTWIMCVGFTLSFGAMFSKTWRVHAIFTNIKLNKKVIKDYKLLLLVALLLTIDIILLSAWQVFDPPRRETRNLQTEIDPMGGDKEIVPVIEFCISDHMTIWLITIYVYKGLLLLFGCFLAWETRHVSIAALNDSKYIGMSVYNVVIMCVSGVPVSFIINDQPNSAFLIIALFILFSTTITLCLVFVPKMVELKRDPNGEEKRIRATLRKNCNKDIAQADMAQKIRNLSEENFRCRQILENKKLEVRELLEQLGEEARDDINPSPVHRALLALRSDGVLHRLNVPAITGSEATLCSDDDSSAMSSSSSAHMWMPEASPNQSPSHQNSLQAVDFIQLRKIPKGKSHRHKVIIHAPGNSIQQAAPLLPAANAPNCDALPKPGHARSASALDNVKSVREQHDDSSHDRRFSTGARTPSYQGLKLLGDIFALKETAILSDSDGSGPASIHSLPEHDDEVDDVTTSLLS